MEKINVAAISTSNWVGDSNRSLKNMEKWLGNPKVQGSELVLFPELNVSGYIHSKQAWVNAEAIPGPSTAKLVKLAGKFNTTICAGILENDTDVIFNTQVLVNKNGVIGKQRKIHIPADEYRFWRGGTEIKVFDLGKIRVGIAICFDALFSEVARALYLAGAEAVLMPFAYWTDIHRSQFPESDITGLSYRTACYENGYFGLVANNAGERASSPDEPKGRKFPGWAGVFGPTGEVLDFSREEGIGESCSVVELDPERLKMRRSNPWFQPRYLKAGIYQKLCAQVGKLNE